MKRYATILRTLAAAIKLSVPATFAHADLSAADIAAIDGKSGIRVFSSDTAFVGITNGLSIREDRVRLFVVPRAGSISRFRGRDVIITTKTNLLTLRNGDLFLDADERRLRVKVQNPASNEDGALTIILFN